MWAAQSTDVKRLGLLTSDRVQRLLDFACYRCSGELDPIGYFKDWRRLEDRNVQCRLLAVALVQEDPTGVQRLIAYVTPSSLSSAELMSGLRGKLPARMMPSSITPLAEVIDSSPEQPGSPVNEIGNPCAAAAP